jgi:uncharacterized SAM-binding protein YcdF (DUF218 family)
MSLLSSLKAVGAPGSLGFLLLCLAIGLAMILVWPKKRTRGIRWCLGVLGVYVVLGIPLVSAALATSLPRYSFSDEAALRRTRLLIVIDGDNGYGRVREAARIYKLAKPAFVWILGSPEMSPELTASGVPAQSIRTYSADKTTLDQMVTVRSMSQTAGPDITLVASRVQMPRIAAMARHLGLVVHLAPAPLDGEPARSGLRRVLPSLSGLAESRDCIYEHAALAYYRWRGWI